MMPSKRLIEHSPALLSINFTYRILRKKFRTRKVYNVVKAKGGRLIRPCDVFAGADRSKVCHLIGAGASLNESVSRIQYHSSVIAGFNNSALYDLPYSVYFIENASPNALPLATQQANLIRSVVHPRGARIVFKNLSIRGNCPIMAVDTFGDVAVFIKDVQIPTGSERSIPEMVRQLLVRDRTHLRQHKSTILTLIALAFRAGFSRIVLHGVDFAGPYFFQTANFRGRTNLMPPLPKAASGEPHATAITPIGLPAVLPHLRRILKSKNCHLYTASSSSPSSSMLPVF